MQETFNKKIEEKKDIVSGITAPSTSAINQENEESYIFMKQYEVIILPLFSFRLKLMGFQTYFLAQGVLVRKNGIPVEINSVINAHNFSKLCHEKIGNHINILYFCEFSQTIKMEKVQKTNYENEEQEKHFLQETLKSLKQCTFGLRKILQVLGIVRTFSKTAKAIKTMLIQDKKKLNYIIEKHRFKDNMENECCKRELEDKVKDDCFPRNCITNVKSMKFSEMEEENFVTGSSCYVREHKVQIEYEKDMQIVKQSKKIAVKRIKEEYEQDLQKQQKLKEQKSIIEKISYPDYIVKYYEPQNNGNEVYMQYIEENLRNKIRLYELFLEDKIYITKQIVQAVLLLHEDGIVHRDLKPLNILITQQNSIKLIDFAQSIKIGTPMMLNDPKFVKLCSTVPYSPLQCLMLCPEGYSKSKIDNWSIGVIITELLLKRLPFCFCKLFEKEIVREWTMNSQFVNGMSWRKKYGFGCVENYMKVISILLMKFRYKDRFCLEGVMQILNLIEQRINKLYML